MSNAGTSLEMFNKQLEKKKKKKKKTIIFGNSYYQRNS